MPTSAVIVFDGNKTLPDLRALDPRLAEVLHVLRAGRHGAVVARPGMVLNGLRPRPEIIGADLREVAEQRIARAGGTG